MQRIVLAITAMAGLLCCEIPSGQAGTYGDAPWCAVSNTGGGGMEWDCQYLSAAQCQPSVVGGNRGFCALNPYSVVVPPPGYSLHGTRHRTPRYPQ